MNTERLNYVLGTVIPHAEGMEVIDDYRSECGERVDDDQIGGCALLNFSWFTERRRETGKAISQSYDCGLEACLAGWYKFLAERDHFIEADHPDLSDFSFEDLAHHFGIEEEDCRALFETRGLGAERRGGPVGGRSPTSTVDCLAARKSYLEGLLAA